MNSLQPIELSIPEKKTKLEKFQTEIDRKDKIIKLMGLAILGLSIMCIAEVMHNQSLKERYKELELKFTDLRIPTLAGLIMFLKQNNCHDQEFRLIQGFYGDKIAAEICKATHGNFK